MTYTVHILTHYRWTTDYRMLERFAELEEAQQYAKEHAAEHRYGTVIGCAKGWDFDDGNGFQAWPDCKQLDRIMALRIRSKSELKPCDQKTPW
jgi:hypothetical protein